MRTSYSTIIPHSKRIVEDPVDQRQLTLTEQQLFDAVGKNDYNGVVCALRAGANVNAHNFFGATPLQYAALNDFFQIGRLLIEKGANVNSTSSNTSWTPLHNAACNGHCRFLQLLIDSGADVHAHDKDGRTPLEVAAHHSRPILEVAMARPPTTNRALKMTKRRQGPELPDR